MKKIFHINSITFITLVSLYFSFGLNISFWQLVFSKVSPDNFNTIVFACSLPFFIFIPLFMLFCLLVVPVIGRPLVAVLLLLSAAADYAMSNLNVIIDSDMIRNFAETNLREAADFVTVKALVCIFVMGIIPAALVLLTDIKFAPFVKETARRLLLCLAMLLVLGAFAFTSYKEYASFGRNNSQARKYINTFNYIYAVGRYQQKRLNAERRFVVLDAAPALNKVPGSRPKLLVLAVGETARAKNFSLYGYERRTNPLLEKQDIIVFSNVSSCGTATAVSLPCMFSADGRQDFDTDKARHTQNLLDIALAAGYKVSWKDNDDGCKGVCSRIETVDAKDGNKQPECFGSYCHDEILLDGLEQKIQNLTQDTVIVLHMMGSHGPTYHKRYPDRFRHFLPACDTADLQNCSRRQITNTYDNTILYTDYVLSSVIDILKKNRNIESGMLYVSDHGESLGENNLYLHGLPYAVAPKEQKEVPMILWLSPLMREKLDVRCLRQKAAANSYSHDNYFHSVLRLLNIATPVYRPQLDIFEDCAGEK